MSQEQEQAALDTLRRDSLAILDRLDRQWIAETEAAIQASEESEKGNCWDRFLESVATSLGRIES